MKHKSRVVLSLLLLVSVALTTGCDNSEFKKQIGEFQKAINDSQAAVTAYYQSLNQFEKDLYFLQRELDPGKDLAALYYKDNADDKALEITENAFYINGPFSPKSVQARLDAIKLIGLYGTRLGELAGTDAPAVFKTNAAALGDNIANLGSTFTELAGNGKDKSAANYAGPIGTLVGIVGKMFLEKKRDDALVEAINEATPAITAVTNQLKKDFGDVLLPVNRTGNQLKIAVLIDYYNSQRKIKGSARKDRKALLDEIQGAVRSYELLTTANPQEMIKSMEAANQALLAYANSKRKDSDFIQLVSYIGEFRDQAKNIVNAVQEIREIRRSLRNAN
jgi:hypothetical protein